MKPLIKKGIQPPQLSKRLPAGEITDLEDSGQYDEMMVTGADLSNSVAKKIHVEQVIFKQVNFQQTRLSFLSILNSHFERSDLSGARWENGRIKRVEMAGCRLMGASFMEDSFEDLQVRDCNAEASNFISSKFKNVRFENCNLQGVSFEGADLSGIVFSRCNLTRAILLNAVMIETDFRSSIIDELSVGINELKGAIFTPTQAVQVAGLLGITIKEWEGEDF